MPMEILSESKISEKLDTLVKAQHYRPILGWCDAPVGEFSSIECISPMDPSDDVGDNSKVESNCHHELLLLN